MSLPKCCSWPLLTTLAFLVGASTARADEIDRAMRETVAEELLDQLVSAGYKNVGVLKFEVQTGGKEGPVSLARGRMNESLATRLENALILAQDECTLGVVRNATAAALSKNPDATYLSPEGRMRLFHDGYPLAWGNTKVKPNAFVTGRLTFAKDWSEAILSISIFDEKNPSNLRELNSLTTTIDVNRQMLCDINESFVLSDSLFQKRGGGSDSPSPFTPSFDEVATPAARKTDAEPKEQPKLPPTTVPPKSNKPEPQPDPPVALKPQLSNVEHLLQFEVLYNDRVQEVRAGNINPPKPNDEIVIRVRSQARLGIVLLVNGINTADSADSNEEIDRYTRWVLEPNTDYMIRGYYRGNMLEKFKVAESESEKIALTSLAPPSRIGLIELYIYREMPAEVAKQYSMPKLGPPPVMRTNETYPTFDETRLAIKREMGVRQSRDLIVPGEAEGADIKVVPFTGVLAAHIVVRYMKVTNR